MNIGDAINDTVVHAYGTSKAHAMFLISGRHEPKVVIGRMQVLLIMIGVEVGDINIKRHDDYRFTMTFPAFDGSESIIRVVRAAREDHLWGLEPSAIMLDDAIGNLDTACARQLGRRKDSEEKVHIFS